MNFKKKENETDVEIFLDAIYYAFQEGYIAQDSNGAWHWYLNKPLPSRKDGTWTVTDVFFSSLEAFEIARVKDWTNSLYKVTKSGWEKI